MEEAISSKSYRSRSALHSHLQRALSCLKQCPRIMLLLFRCHYTRHVACVIKEHTDGIQSVTVHMQWIITRSAGVFTEFCDPRCNAPLKWMLRCSVTSPFWNCDEITQQVGCITRRHENFFPISYAAQSRPPCKSLFLALEFFFLLLSLLFAGL